MFAQVLVLTYNDIQRMEGLAELPGLQRLDLAHNMIKKVEGLKGLAALQHLDLSSNQVGACGLLVGVGVSQALLQRRRREGLDCFPEVSGFWGCRSTAHVSEPP